MPAYVDRPYLVKIKMRTLLAFLVLPAVILLAGCPGDSGEREGTVATPVPQDAGPVAPAPGGEVHVIDMVTDGEGNYFAPADFEVRRGDVIRWRLRTGVHNAHFLADSNPGARNLPPISPMMQLPGQTFDVLVDMEPGHYYYQCDPHVLLGMVGHVTVR